MKIDLFEKIETLPIEVQNIINEYNVLECNYGLSYIELNQLEANLKTHGYSFEWGLDCTPYNLKKLNN
jgi:type II secretory pathway component PulC